jgi:hypothetical protein
MTVRIRSLVTSGPLLVPLSSGSCLRLSPGEVTDALAEVDITSNAKVDKLTERRLINVEQVDEDPSPEVDAPAAASHESDHENSSAEASPRGSRSRKR